MPASGSGARLAPISVFAVSVLAVAVAAAALAVSIYLELDRGLSAPRENLQWAAYQLQAEHQRMMLATRTAELGRIDIESLDQRYQIFVSRIFLLRDGVAFEGMRHIPGFSDALKLALDLIPQVDTELSRAGTDVQVYASILTKYFGEMEASLQRIALDAVGTASRQQQERQTDILDGLSYLAVTLLLIVAATAGLAFVSIKQLTALESARRNLAVALWRAEASNRAKSGFLAGMSHEMRTPLNAVMGMLREIGYRTSDRGIHHFVEVAHSSAEMLCGLVDDVLDTTRIETGKFHFQYTTFDPSGLIAEVASVLASRAMDRNNTVSIDVSALPTRFIVSDRSRVKQVLINLLGNAIKYTHNGQIDLVATAIPAADDLTMLRVSISDTGVGIPPEQQGRIFDRFFQAGNTDGLGLGLSISRDIVERLGGRIGVDSRQGHGSTFWFEVPVTISDSTSCDTSRRTQGALAGVRLLIAEDNSTNRQVVRLMLERQGATFDFAHDGQQAAAMALSGSYDAILMDINMPVMGGLEAMAEIRRRHPSGGPPVLALTADALPQDHARFLAAGMAACVTKPIDEAEMLDRISGLVGRSAPSAVERHEPARPASGSLTTGQRSAVLELLSAIDDDPELPA